MNRKGIFISITSLITVMFIVLLGTTQITAQERTLPEITKLEPISSPLGTAFTYQGRLNNNGNPAGGSHHFKFALYDAETGGNQVGDDYEVPTSVEVTDGLFTVEVDFGSEAFNGEERWMEIQVKPSGGTYTTLTTRHHITAVPYALKTTFGQIWEGSGIAGLAIKNNDITGSGVAILDPGVAGGIVIVSDLQNDPWGLGMSIYNTYTGIKVDEAKTGVWVNNPENNGISVTNSGGDGVVIDSAIDAGIVITDSGGEGVRVHNPTGNGVMVKDPNSYGVRVDWNTPPSPRVGTSILAGEAQVAMSTGLSDYGFVSASNGYGIAVSGSSQYAGYFDGNLFVTGSCTGCLIANFALNSGQTTLEPGDAVAIRGMTNTNLDETPVIMDVALARGNDAVVGIVAGSAEPNVMIQHDVAHELDSAKKEQESQTISHLVPREGAAQPGEYVSIIIYGVTQVKASAVGEKIEAGMRLTAADRAGHTRALKTVEVQGMQVAESAPVVGIALEELPKGQEGLIWVLVNPQ